MDAYEFDPKRDLKYEVIDGQIVYLSPLAKPNHAITVRNIAMDITQYLKDKKCNLYHENNYLRLDKIEELKKINLPKLNQKKDRYIPDIMVVCDAEIDTADGVVGAPVLIIEVASPSTENYDRKIKKDVYEAIGVSEYWIVRPKDTAIEVYLLKDGKYDLDNIYYKYSESELRGFDLEREDGVRDFKVITEFSPHSFPDLVIKTDDVFAKFIE